MIRQHAEMWARTEAGLNFPSKAAIKRFLTEGKSIVWTEIGTVGNGWQDRDWTTDELCQEIGDSGRTLLVVGPNPYTKRSYYGTVSVKNGEVKVS